MANELTLPTEAGAERRGGGIVNECFYWGLMLYLLLYATEGAARYFLHLYSLEWAIYIRDLFMIVTVAYGFLAPQLKVRPMLIGAVCVLALGSLVGLLLLPSVAQVAFGIKVYLPLLAGFVGGAIFFERPQRTATCCLILLIIVAIGVIISAKVDLPWLGLTYQLGSTTVEAQRDWSIEGIQRVSGFSRASFDAGTQLVIFGVIGTAFLRSRAISWALWLAVAPCLYLTTARSPMLAYIFVTLYRLAGLCSPGWKVIFQRAAVLLPCMVILLPLLESSSLPTFIQKANLSGVAGVDSLYTRLETSWPDAFELVRHDGSRWFGRGVGGIGSPQDFFEPDASNPADNLFVYLWADFGIGSILLLAALALLLQTIRVREDDTESCMFELGLVFFGIGMLLSAVEGLGLLLITGMMIQKAAYRLQSASVSAPSLARVLFSKT